MGFPKQNLIHQESGLTLLEWQALKWREHFKGLLVVSESGSKTEGHKIISDPPEFHGEGPLAGILAACRVCRTEWLAVLALDCPNFSPGLFQSALQQAKSSDEVLVYRDNQGKIHWLCSLWKQSVKERLEQELRKGQRSVKILARSLNLKILDLPSKFESSVFLNLNEPADLERAPFSTA